MKARLNQYQNGAAETALYPGRLGILQDGQDLTGIYYTAMGLAGESGELLEKILWSSWVNDDIIKEMGDTLWCISQCAMELGCTLSFIYDAHCGKYTSMETQLEVASYVSSKAGTYCDCVKKCLRDNNGHLSSKYRGTLLENLSMMLRGIEEMCNNYNISLQSVMDANYQKLISRKERNVLNGDGDNR